METIDVKGHTVGYENNGQHATSNLERKSLSIHMVTTYKKAPQQKILYFLQALGCQ